MDQSCPQKLFLQDLTLFYMYYFWLHVIFLLTLHTRHKLVAWLSTWSPELYMLYATNSLLYMSIDGQHLCLFHLLGLTSFADILFRHFRIDISFPLADFCLPLDVTNLQGPIYSPSSIIFCSHLFIFLSLNSY